MRRVSALEADPPEYSFTNKQNVLNSVKMCIPFKKESKSILNNLQGLFTLNVIKQVGERPRGHVS